jgi:hypothetical protein
VGAPERLTEEDMRRCTLFTVVSTVLVSPGALIAEELPGTTEVAVEAPAAEVAEETASDATAAADELSWEQFDDPSFDPAAAPQTAPAAEPARPSASASAHIVLGPEGVDDQGRRGRIHTVASGDTLWDISAAYLGTPWVWPSVWTDNDEIDNPHLIHPADRIWITADEMRVVTEAEAESFMAAIPTEVVEEPAVEEIAEEPAIETPVAAFDGEADEEPASEAMTMAVPGQAPDSLDPGRQVTVSRRDAAGFLGADRVAGAATIVDSPSVRTYLAQGDLVYLGLGEGDAEVGDEFTIFTAVDEVRDFKTRRLLGHHVDTLGWLEIIELTGDTSIGRIRMSYSEIPRGSRVTPRVESPRRVTVRMTPDAVEGRVVFLPSERTVMAEGGYVYLNRGELHGVETGSELEVFESGEIVSERARGVDVRTPDRVVARLVVVTVEAETSVAYVLTAERELEVGDTVRPAMSRLAQR